MPKGSKIVVVMAFTIAVVLYVVPYLIYLRSTP